jgi:hypothetical protein
MVRQRAVTNLSFMFKGYSYKIIKGCGMQLHKVICRKEGRKEGRKVQEIFIFATSVSRLALGPSDPFIGYQGSSFRSKVAGA